MNGSLWLLLGLSLRGRATRFVRQLRQPKYLVGLVVGAGWMALWIGRPFLGRSSEISRGLEWTRDGLPLLRVGLALATAAFFGLAWLLPWVRSALSFREAELHLLLPAPIPRRGLIEFALVRAQVPILFSSFFFTLVLGSGGPLRRLLSFAGFWVLLTAWELHARWRSLSLLRLRSLSPLASARRRIAIVAFVLIYALALAAALAPAAARLVSWAAVLPRDLDSLLAILRGAATSPALGWLLTPFLWITGGIFAASPREALASLVPALGVLLLLREAVVRSRALFEEPALERAVKEASRRSPARRFARRSERSRRKAPFPLRGTGAPELAIVWKNLMQVSRTPLLATVSVFALAALGFAAASRTPIAGAFGTGLGFFLTASSPFLAGLGLRNDLRSELAHLELVRAWPLPAHRLVLAEILAPTLLGTGLGLFGLVLVAATRLGTGPGAAGLGEGTTMLFAGIGVVPVLAGMTGLLVTLSNLAAVLFPAWTGLGRGAATGLAASGQQMLYGLALLLALAVGLLPGAVLVGLAALAQWGLGIGFVPAALPVWGLLVALPLGFEIALGTRILGRMWEQLDPAREILETA